MFVLVYFSLIVTPLTNRGPNQDVVANDRGFDESVL